MNFIPKLDGVVTENVFTEKEVKKILDTKIINKEDGLVYSSEDEKFINNGSRKTILYHLSDIDWIKNKILERVGKINKEHWKFNFVNMLENPTLMDYKKNSWYDWNMDIGEIKSEAEILTMRKISYSILLNNDFEGGSLDFQGKSFKNTPIGTGIFFPSYLIHKVSTVTSGIRRSLVGWVDGHPFS